MLNILSTIYKFFFGGTKLTPFQVEKIFGKEFLENEEPLTNKERFKRDFHNKWIYKNYERLHKERLKKYRELREGKKPSHFENDWKIANVEYDKFVEKYSDLYNMCLKSYETVYASVVAHYKGKLHMNKISWKNLSNLVCPYFFWDWGTLDDYYLDKDRQIFRWTMEDQERLIGKFLESYR